MTAAEKAWIDGASYEDLLRRWRFAEVGDAMFQGDTGDYYEARMQSLRAEAGGSARHVAASKTIGWGD
jgi:hypothetical protein